MLNLRIAVRDMGAGKVCPLGEKMGGMQLAEKLLIDWSVEVLWVGCNLCHIAFDFFFNVRLIDGGFLVFPSNLLLFAFPVGPDTQSSIYPARPLLRPFFLALSRVNHLSTLYAFS